MTHSDMTPEDLDRCGILDSMVRLSVGLDSSDGLLEDLLGALESVLMGFTGINACFSGQLLHWHLGFIVPKNDQDAD